VPDLLGSGAARAMEFPLAPSSSADGGLMNEDHGFGGPCRDGVHQQATRGGVAPFFCLFTVTSVICIRPFYQLRMNLFLAFQIYNISTA
jgi:hypothetical protein